MWAKSVDNKHAASRCAAEDLPAGPEEPPPPLLMEALKHGDAEYVIVTSRCAFIPLVNLMAIWSPAN
jgi:hypothetical protein